MELLPRQSVVKKKIFTMFKSSSNRRPHATSVNVAAAGLPVKKISHAIHTGSHQQRKPIQKKCTNNHHTYHCSYMCMMPDPSCVDEEEDLNVHECMVKRVCFETNCYK